MSDYAAIYAYQQASANGASPVGQIVSLYDTILRDFRRALAAVETGNVESRVFETNHALTVVAHLQNVLDLKRGGEAAKHLNSFYNVTRGIIVEASANSSRETLGRLIDLYSGLRDAWHQAELQLPADQTPPPPAAPRANTPANQISNTASTIDSAETPRGNWSA